MRAANIVRAHCSIFFFISLYCTDFNFLFYTDNAPYCVKNYVLGSNFTIDYRLANKLAVTINCFVANIDIETITMRLAHFWKCSRAQFVGRWKCLLCTESRMGSSYLSPRMRLAIYIFFLLLLHGKDKPMKWLHVVALFCICTCRVHRLKAVSNFCV